jgi:uncharacterized protein
LGASDGRSLSVVAPGRSNLFDLEDPRDLARLGDPTLSLSPLAGTVVIDEAQRSPELFPVLRVLVTKTDGPADFWSSVAPRLT